MNDPVKQRRRSRRSPPQPIDRHLSEVDELAGTIYINAGIDSTCSKKRSRTIYKLTDGVVVPSTEIPDLNERTDLAFAACSSDNERRSSANPTNDGRCIL